MTCDELKQQAAAYALGALDAAERAACDQHLRAEIQHQGCAEALRAAAENAQLLAEALPPVTPAASTWAAIEGRLRQSGGARRPPMVLWLLAAAAVILIVWLGLDRSHLQDQMQANETRMNACATQLAKLQKDAALQKEAMALLRLPGTRLIALSQQQATAQANVIYHRGEKRAFVVGSQMAAPSGKDYELWMIRGDKKIPAGLLKADESGGLIAAVDPALLADGPPDAMAVTLEAAGGRPQPEGPIVLVGKI